jgi:hypothetical protein
MQCPKVDGLVHIVSKETATLVVDLEYESGVALLSNTFDWSKP